MRIVTVQNRVCVALVLLAGLMTAGCNTTAQTTGSVAARSAYASSPSVAFESIDGPPPGVFQKLVQNLDAEATSRQLPIVSRQGPANYRIRGYLAAHVINNRTSYTWVWDVYDADQRRALRISGEIPGRAGGGDAWAGADDEVLRRIAQTGMDRVAAFIASPTANAMANAAPASGGATYAVASATTAPAATPDEPSRQTFAQNDDFSPESAGIFRLLRPSEPAARATVPAQIAAAEPSAVPMPRQRPANSARKPGTTVTLAAGPDTTQD